jgi:hypothetical protein
VHGYFVMFSALFTFATKGDKPLIPYSCSRLRKPPQGESRKPKKRYLSDAEVSRLIELRRRTGGR